MFLGKEKNSLNVYSKQGTSNIIFQKGNSQNHKEIHAELGEIELFLLPMGFTFLEGGGGTSFDPVFNYIKSNRFKRFDGCVYLTDGYANEPTIVPPCKVFWLITPDGTTDNIKFGRCVKLE